MAHEFLQHGDNVVICGRDGSRLAAAVQHLLQHSTVQPDQLVEGIQCDVSVAADVDHLAERVSNDLGVVHR